MTLADNLPHAAGGGLFALAASISALQGLCPVLCPCDLVPTGEEQEEYDGWVKGSSRLYYIVVS